MLDAGIGVLRTLPAAEPDAVDALRAVARGLGIDWPAGTTPAELLSGLPRDTPAALALRRAATSLLRGAGYTAFDTADGAPPPADPGHAGIGAPYAHVTAPLRRLVDRFGTELCLAVTAGAEVPGWLRAALPTLPETMAAIGRGRERGLAGRRRPDRGGAAGRPRRYPLRRGRAAGARPTPRPGRCTCSIRPCWPAAPGRCGWERRRGCGSTEADPATGRIAFRAST